MMDELYTNLEMGGSIVYKLTDVAQEMIFMSREMAEEWVSAINPRTDGMWRTHLEP